MMYLKEEGGLHHDQYGLQLQKAARSRAGSITRSTTTSAFFSTLYQRRRPSSLIPKPQLFSSEPKDKLLGNDDVGRIPRAAVSAQPDARRGLGEKASRFDD